MSLILLIIHWKKTWMIHMQYTYTMQYILVQIM